MKVSAILLAAGSGTRFGGNKLLADYQGKPLFEHTLQKVCKLPFHQVILVTQYPELAARVGELPVHAVMNPDPRRGISSSIRLGLAQCQPCDGMMFFVCDQPHLRIETIQAMLCIFQEAPHQILSASYGDRRGNPVIFPYSFYEELLQLEGEQGGSLVLQHHAESVRYVQVSHPSELFDIDRREDLLAPLEEKLKK